jgi:hypothetical protein
VEIPLIFIFIAAIRFNDTASGLLKLYPLIVCSAFAIIFALVYFFNAVIISYSKIKQFGVFSSRDSALISKDRTLVLTYLPKRKMRVELYTLQSEPALLCINPKDYAPSETNIFRERVIGSNLTAKRVLKFFGLSSSEISDFLANNSGYIKTDEIEFKSEIADGQKKISLKFLKTL